MNEEYISLDKFEIIASWFDQIFNEIFNDKIKTNLELNKEKKIFNWSIKTNKKTIFFPIDQKLYRMKKPYYYDEKLDNEIIKKSEYKLNYLHILRSTNTFLKNKNKINDSDVLGIVFWYLSRVEEVNSFDKKDRYERFSYYVSHSYKSNTIERPVVDEWFCYLSLILFGRASYKKRYKVNLTHDIDTLFRYDRSSKYRKYKTYLRDLLRFKEIIYLNKEINKRNIRKFCNSNLDPYNNLDYLMDISEKHNLKSIFFFIPSNRRSVMDGDYDIDESEIIELLKTINKRNHLIGLHPGFESIRNPELAIKDSIYFDSILKKLGIKKISNSRMHLLRWKHPETIYMLVNMGIKEDWTLGFPEKIGFRCGTSYPYKMIDPVEIKIVDIVQFPLHIMDFTLISKFYMNIKDSYSIIKEIKKIIISCKKFNGNLNILWHNNNVTWSRDKHIYELIVNELI